MTDSTTTEVSACPACGSTDIRLVRDVRCTEVYPLTGWRAGAKRPVFVAADEPTERDCEVLGQRVECVNGHAHPDRIGFDLEWSQAGSPS